MIFGSDIHVPQKMNPTDIGDSLTFPMSVQRQDWTDCHKIWCKHLLLHLNDFGNPLT